MLKFINTCDRFRRTPEGENSWQEMMRTKEEISELKFIKMCDVSAILDEDETWEEYKYFMFLQDDVKYYRSLNGFYFFQTVGFEYIWR